MKHLMLFTLIITIPTFNAYSQDFEGTIEYRASYENLTKEMAAMMPDDEDSKFIFYIKGTKTKMEMDMMGMTMISLGDMETNTNTS